MTLNTMGETTLDDLMKVVQEQERITASHLEGQTASGAIVLNRNLDQIRHESEQQLQQLGGSVNPVLAV